MLKDADRVLVVGAKYALKEYQYFSVYICQGKRFFRPSQRMAFYSDKAIHRHVPKILGAVESMMLSRSAILNQQMEEWQRERLFQIVEKLEAGQAPEWARLDYQVKVLFLSAQSSPDTLVLPHEI